MLKFAYPGFWLFGRQQRKFTKASLVHLSSVVDLPLGTQEYDAIIIGAGHNGLVAASYLQKNGLKTLTLERRHVIGGAAVTEEIVPGFKFSRCSYVLSLLRPQIYQDLELKKHGLKVYLRTHYSYTPISEEYRKSGAASSLLLGMNQSQNITSIAKFSQKDAQSYLIYEEEMEKMAEAIEPLLDAAPLEMGEKGRILQKLQASVSLLNTGWRLGKKIPSFYELLTSPTTKILDRWFESQPLKATLATDAVIGAWLSPSTPGSGYVLLHHVMGGLQGDDGAWIKGAWGFPEGGMGAVSSALASAARSYGATIMTDKAVSQVLVSGDGREVEGVQLTDGTAIHSKMVLSNATPKTTYLDLTPPGSLSGQFTEQVAAIDYTSPVTKINVAVNRLPNFSADPNLSDNTVGPQHTCTIHLNCEAVDCIEHAFNEAQEGLMPSRPIIEMCIPSSLDPTLAPKGSHVITLFTQYTPYLLKNGQIWDEASKNIYADRVFDVIEEYAPGFKSSVIGRDILTPPDLEKIFGLTGGNIFHGAMSLNQLYFTRPVTSYSDYRSPLRGLYLCGSGAHPGGGVMGSPGRNAANIVLKDYNSAQS